jgi:hypothetical protein
MKMKQVSEHCYVVLKKNRVCDANSGLINPGGGVIIDTQYKQVQKQQKFRKKS